MKEKLHVDLIHADGGGTYAGGGVRNVAQLQKALYGAVFAMKSVEYRNDAVQPGDDHLLFLGKQALTLLPADQRPRTGRQIQLHPANALAVFVKGGIGCDIKQRIAGKPFALLADINRDHVIGLAVGGAHQLHGADDRNLVFAAPAAKHDAQLNLAHGLSSSKILWFQIE